MDDETQVMANPELELGDICDGNLHKLITAHAHALGVPPEFIFMPLLASSSVLLGGSGVKVSDLWVEGCPLWTACVTGRGTRKSATLRFFEDAILDLAKEDTKKTDCEIFNDVRQEIRCGNDRQLGLVEDLGLFTKYSNDGPNIVSLKEGYKGASCRWRSKVSGVCSMFGFIHPAIASSSFKELDRKTFSHLLVLKSREVSYKFRDFKSMPSNTPGIKKVFSVLQKTHSVPKLYELSQSALQELEKAYDSFEDNKVALDEDNDNRGIFIVAPGQLLRLAVCLTALRQAVKVVVYHEDLEQTNWNTILLEEDIQTAVILLDACIKQKLFLLGQRCNGDKIGISQDVASPQTNITPQVTPQPENTQKKSPASSIKLKLPTKARPILPKEPAKPQYIPHPSPMVPAAIPSPSSQPQFPGFPPGFAFPVYMSGPADAPKIMMSQVPAGWDGCGTTRNAPPAVLGTAQQIPGNSDNQELVSNEDPEDLTQEELQFVATHAYKIKKCLEFHLDMRITPSVCAQRHLMPPLSKSEMSLHSTQTRYPVSMAREFLLKLSQLGFYTIEETVHPTNSRRNLTFVKVPYEILTPKAKGVLEKVELDSTEYMSPYRLHQGEGKQGMKRKAKDISRRSSHGVLSSTLRDQSLMMDGSPDFKVHLSEAPPIKIEPVMDDIHQASD